MPAESEREEEGDRDGERASEPGTRELRLSDSSAAADSRSVKRRDDNGGDPARHGTAAVRELSGWQSRPSGGRDKDERRDPFRRAKRSVVREKKPRKEERNRSDIRRQRYGSSRSIRIWLRLCIFGATYSRSCRYTQKIPMELEKKSERARY